MQIRVARKIMKSQLLAWHVHGDCCIKTITFVPTAQEYIYICHILQIIKVCHVWVQLGANNLHGCELPCSCAGKHDPVQLPFQGFMVPQHSSKWVCLFSHFLPYTSGLKVLACSLNTNLNYVKSMLQLPPFLNK